MHQTVLSAFPLLSTEEKQRKGSARSYFNILYRIDKDNQKNQIFILVQSNTSPDWSKLPTHYSLELNNNNKGIYVKNIKALPLKIEENSIFAFKLRANPTQKKSDRSKKNINRIPFMKEQDQIKWLLKKGQLHGFQVLSLKLNKDMPNLLLQDQSLYQGKKKQGKKIHKLTFFSVLFEGLMKIIDKKKFVIALQNGIGSGKGFGFGLVTLARYY